MIAANMEAAGGAYYVTAIVGSLADWFRPDMDEAAWAELFANLDRVETICRAHGLTQVVHPHVDTLIETADEFEIATRAGLKLVRFEGDLIAVNLNLSLEERQKLLETTSVKERLTSLLPMLNREHEVLTLSSKIQTEVATSISKTQRDFFLREQLRAIQRELGEAEPNANEIKTLRDKVAQTPMPAEVKKVATQELER